MSEKDTDSTNAGALALAGELRLLISQLSRKLREQAHLGDYTFSQTSALVRLERDGPATVTALARVEGVKPQSMGTTVATLEAAGLVSGSPDPADGRRTILSLTDKCREMVKANRAAKDDWLFQAIQSKLSAAEQENLATSLELLKRLGEAPTERHSS